MSNLDKVMQDMLRETGIMLRGAHLSASEIHKEEGQANYCTDCDLRIQRFIMARLSEIMPGCSF